MNHVKELLADIGKRIAEEEIKTRQTIDRLLSYNDRDVRDDVREEWHRFHLRIEPMRQQREYVLKQIVQVEAMQVEITQEMTDAALHAWFASPPSETDQGLERSMRAALEAALNQQIGKEP